MNLTVTVEGRARYPVNVRYAGIYVTMWKR